MIANVLSKLENKFAVAFFEYHFLWRFTFSGNPTNKNSPSSTYYVLPQDSFVFQKEHSEIITHHNCACLLFNWLIIILSNIYIKLLYQNPVKNNSKTKHSDSKNLISPQISLVPPSKKKLNKIIVHNIL